jgi:myosin heavy subunit
VELCFYSVFKVNSFEQLCINYCNERLQTFFNEVIFDGEIKMYKAEGVPCDDITYQDNVGCVKLIDNKGASLFACLGGYFSCFACVATLISIFRLLQTMRS